MATVDGTLCAILDILAFFLKQTFS